MLSAELLCFRCFQWKSQVPSFSGLWLYTVKGLACATLNMLQKEAHVRDKSSPLFSPPDHTASCYQVSPRCERDCTGFFQGKLLSSRLSSCKKLEAAPGPNQSNNGPFTFNMASREVGKAEQVSRIAARRLPTAGPFKKMNSECQTAYIYFLHQRLAN